MKLWVLILAVICGATAQPANKPVRAKALEIEAFKQKANKLDLVLVAPQRRYKRGQQLKMFVMLVNSSKEDMYVLGELEWGSAANLFFHIRDASGKDVRPMGFPDDLIHSSANDRSAFVKLLPNHFLGTDFFAPLDVLSINKPGKYSIFVEYHSPFASTEVQLSPFWGKENGTLTSNVVYLEVLR